MIIDAASEFGKTDLNRKDDREVFSFEAKEGFVALATTSTSVTTSS